MSWWFLFCLWPVPSLLTARNLYRRGRPYTAPVSHNSGHCHGDPHKSECYARHPDWSAFRKKGPSPVNSKEFTAVLALGLGLLWPLTGLVEGAARLGQGLCWLVTAGHPALPEEREYEIARMEKENKLA